METEVAEDGKVIVTKGCEVSTGGMTVLILAVCVVGIIFGCLLTNANDALQFAKDVYRNKQRNVQVNHMQWEGHDYLFLTESGKEDVFGFCHDPKCSCKSDEEQYVHRSMEGLKYGVTMMGTYLQSAVEQTVNEGNGKGNTNAVPVSVVPHFNAGLLVNQKKGVRVVGERCDKDGTPNPKGKYRRRELSTSKTVDTSEIGNWKSGQSAPKVSAEIIREN